MAVHDLNGAPQAAPGPILDIRNLEVVYNDISLAVRGISLHVPEGSAVALLGANGAGKTTTIRAVSGLLYLYEGHVREGEIAVAGRSVNRLRPHQIVALGVAQVPEGRMVFGHLTVEENLRVGAASRRDGRTQDVLAQVFDLFPVLKERRRQESGWMSGGEQQMIAIGRALMASPRLLLLDEVSLGLAPRVIESIFGQLARVRAELGTAMLLVEQNAALALEFADYGYIMENGRVVLDGPAERLLNNPDVQEFYLGINEDTARSYAAVKHYKRRKRWLQ